MVETNWGPVTKTQRIAFAVGAALFFLLLARSEPGGMFLLDGANLLFHEAGHPIVGLFSQRLEPYGGTLFQLVMPAVLAVSFWRKRQALAMAVAGIWFFQNFLSIAHYMADARALQLPLVGGGEHDWNNIFFRWNVLSYDTRIAAAVQTCGWIGMISVAAFAIVWPWGKTKTAGDALQ